MEPQLQQRRWLGSGWQIISKILHVDFAKYTMETFHVNVVCAVSVEALAHPFRYRVYVKDELFTERTWIWQDVYFMDNNQSVWQDIDITDIYLEEMLPISAPPGIYPVKFELVNPERGKIQVRNYRVTGPARIIDYQGQTAVEISNESS